jgi:hypothetical protein
MADQMKQNGNFAKSGGGGSFSPGAHRAMLVLKWAARIFALIIAVQVFLAGLALFVDSGNWVAHSNFARVFLIIPILMILLAFIARLPITFRVMSIQLVIMVILMFVTADLSKYIGILSALHPVIALAMFWIAMTLSKQAAAHTN